MTVKAILSRKGSDVVTIAPTANLAAAVKLLAERRIGAVIVTGAGQSGGRHPVRTRYRAHARRRAAPAALDEKSRR